MSLDNNDLINSDLNSNNSSLDPVLSDIDECLEINHSNCIARKKSNIHLQCNHKRKFGEFCGIHYNKCGILRIDQPLEKKQNTKIKSLEENIVCDLDILPEKSKTEEGDIPNDVIVERKKEKKISQPKLLDLEMLKKKVNIRDIKFTLQYYNYFKTFKRKYNKEFLLEKLKELLKLFDNCSEKKQEILTIQSGWRGYCVRKLYGPGVIKSKCVNDTEFYTFENIQQAKKDYFFSIRDMDNFVYFFDIRSICKLLDNEGNGENPYNRKKFSEKTKKNISNRLNFMKKNNIPIDYENNIVVELTPIQKMELDTVRIFQKFDELDQYTDPNWFLKLSMEELIDLYIKLEDIWCYRTFLDSVKKKKIIKNGLAFNIPLHVIKAFPLSKKIDLQYILLSEFKRFAEEGLTRDDKILGVMMILTGIVEVSQEAAYALPHLAQIF